MALLSISLSHLPSSTSIPSSLLTSTSSAASSAPSSFVSTSPPSHTIAQWSARKSTGSQFLMINPSFRLHKPLHIVRMAPEEEKMTRRSPLDFPIEWERPKPGRRPDIFPQFSPMKTPLPPPLPADPPEDDEDEEEEGEKKEEEEEEPEKEDPDKPAPIT